jgi:hypothetical protein
MVRSPNRKITTMAKAASISNRSVCETNNARFTDTVPTVGFGIIPLRFADPAHKKLTPANISERIARMLATPKRCASPQYLAQLKRKRDAAAHK